MKVRGDPLPRREREVNSIAALICCVVTISNPSPATAYSLWQSAVTTVRARSLTLAMSRMLENEASIDYSTPGILLI
jgi:hypothetical protein